MVTLFTMGQAAKDTDLTPKAIRLDERRAGILPMEEESGTPPCAIVRGMLTLRIQPVEATGASTGVRCREELTAAEFGTMCEPGRNAALHG